MNFFIELALESHTRCGFFLWRKLKIKAFVIKMNCNMECAKIVIKGYLQKGSVGYGASDGEAEETSRPSRSIFDEG